MALPGPSSVYEFPALPDSRKSTLEGDTIQVPNISAYFSDHYREDGAIPFYLNEYRSKTYLPFPPVRLNYPPEYAFATVKDQTHSTYLEEFVYPLRDSLFVNGLEPFDRSGVPRYRSAVKFEFPDRSYWTKVTLRYYPSSLPVRLAVWLGVVSSIYLLWNLGRKVVSDE